MVLEPRVLAGSAKATSEFLRLAQPAETKGPVKVDKIGQAGLKMLNLGEPRAMHGRALSAGIRCGRHRRYRQTGSRQSQQKAARCIWPSQ
jgi:hypothetical protein